MTIDTGSRSSVTAVRAALWVAGCLAIGLPPPVFAQEPVNEIIVTARKRQESLQEVPLSISTFDAEGLKERNIQSVYDVATFTPNFSFTRNAVGRRLDAPSIRGQFTPLQNYGSEGNVAFFVDGVYVSGTAGTLTIDNVARVEVLRGPQAALFGRAAFAGAVNYITREATNELDGEVYLKAGEESDYKTSGWISGPLIEDKLLFFGSASWESFDGEWQNSMNPCKAGQTAADGCVTLNPKYKPFWPAGQPVSTVEDDFTKLGGESTWNTTGKLTWIASEDLTVNVKAEYTKSDDEHYASLLQPDLNCYLPGSPGASAVSPGWYCGELSAKGLRAIMNIADLKQGATSNWGVVTDDVQAQAIARPAPFIGTRTETRRYLTEGLYDLAGWELAARATLNRQKLESYRDLDRSPYLGPVFVNLFDSGELQKWSDNSYEFRATSAQDKPIRGTGGVYYFTADSVGFQREFTGFCNRLEFGQPLINGENSWSLKAKKENLAFFGGLDYDVAEDVTISAETRYAKDTPKQYAANGVTAEANYYSFTPRVTVTWKPTDDLNIYGLVAKGNKPGGFFYGYFDAPVLRAATEASLRPGPNGEPAKGIILEETAWTYEAGAKTQWLDRRLTANVSVYYIDWKNQAINEIDQIPWNCADTQTASDVQNNFIKNAGKSTVVGAEVELTFAATENLTLAVNYGLADTELKSYNSITLADLTVTPGTPANPDPEADRLLRTGLSVAGNEAPRVPKNTITTSATYRRPLGDGGADWFFRGDYIYNSKTWLDADNLTYVGALNLVNTRIGIETEAWTAAFYIDNLTGDDTPLLGTEFPNFNNFTTVTSAFHVVPRRDQNAGITLQYRF